jgi:hypothetical protein
MLNEGGTGLKGLTLVTVISLDGAAFVPTVNAASEVTGGDGDYTLVLDATEKAAGTAVVLATSGGYGTRIRIAPAPLDATATANAAATGADAALTAAHIATREEVAASEEAVTAAVMTRYAATGTGGVAPRLIPAAIDELIAAGTDTTLTFDADTAGRVATFTLTPKGSTTPALTVTGTANGATTEVALTDAQTAALSGTYNAELTSTLGSDTRRDASGLVTVA